jgi:uncharacterized protein (DUF1330 family)
MPKAYVVAEIRVTNPEKYADYRALSTAANAQYGGTWLARGGERVQLEGEDETHNPGWRTVIVEFPSLAAARAWYDSPEYAKAREIRTANSIGRLFIIEGV